jgi:uncharacterized membrane protein YbhN (UPF0104 family)
MSRLSDLANWASRHRRLLGAVQLIVLVVFFAAVAWALRGSIHGAVHDLKNANVFYFALGCAALAAYYLVFVLGWMRILSEWGVDLPYPAALRAEMISAVAGVIVFVVSLPFVDEVDAPLWPLVTFGGVLAILVQPRVFRPLAGKVLHKIGYKKELPDMRGRTVSMLLVFYAGTWVLGGFALWLLLRSVGAHPQPVTIVYLGGTAAVGAIVAVVFVFAPSGLGPREASMYGLLLGVATPGQALGAVALNRVALTLVELLVLFVGGILLRGVNEPAAAAEGPPL